MRTTITALVSLLFYVSVARAQTTPTQEEIARWEKSPKALETSPCKIVTWLLESEQKKDGGHQRIHEILGWWGQRVYRRCGVAVQELLLKTLK